MKRVFILLILASLFLSACCFLGDACESGVMDSVNATETSAANELHIQLTLQAQAQP